MVRRMAKMLARGTMLCTIAILGMGCNQSVKARPRESPAASYTKNEATNWVGRAVTPFTLPDEKGKSVNLADVLGKKSIVLIFYRGSWCPFCHGQLQEFADAKAKLTATGAVFYAISNEDAEKHKKMKADHKLDFVTFLSDPKGEAAKQFAGTYGADTQEGAGVLKPATLVIGKDGKIAYAYVNENYQVRATSEAVLKTLTTPP